MFADVCDNRVTGVGLTKYVKYQVNKNEFILYGLLSGGVLKLKTIFEPGSFKRFGVVKLHTTPICGCTTPWSYYLNTHPLFCREGCRETTEKLRARRYRIYDNSVVLLTRNELLQTTKFETMTSKLKLKIKTNI